MAVQMEDGRELGNPDDFKIFLSCSNPRRAFINDIIFDINNERPKAKTKHKAPTYYQSGTLLVKASSCFHLRGV